MELLAKTCKTEQANVQRIFARVFTAVGILFWFGWVWGAEYAYQGSPFFEAVGSALLFAAPVVVVFIVGMFYENIAAILMALTAVGIVVYGFVQGWETGVWATMFFFYVLPAVIASVLYALAARMQRICAL